MTASTTYESIPEGEDESKSESRSSFVYRGKRYRVVPKRWGMLLIVCWILLLDIITLAFFAFINDVTSVYFRTPPAVTDWLSTINLVARAAFGIIICFFSQRMSFRTIAMMASGLMTVANILIICGVSSRGNYGFVIVGQIFSGCAAAMVLSIIQLVAFNWFPLWERGKAVSFPWVTRRLSTVFSNLIATRSLGTFTLVSRSGNEIVEPSEESLLVFRFRFVFSIVYGLLALAALLCCVISRVYVNERPPVVKEEEDESCKPDESSSLVAQEPFSLRKELEGLKYLFTDFSFNLIFTLYCFVLTVRPLFDILLSSLIIQAFPYLNDHIVGIMYCVGISLGSFGSPTAGQILDIFSRPRLTFLGFNGSVTIALCLFSISLYMQWFILSCISYVVLLFSRDATMVCLSHRITGTMTKESNAVRVKAFSLTGSVPFLSVAITAVIVRAILSSSNAAFAVLFPIPFLVLSSLAYVFLWKYLQDT